MSTKKLFIFEWATWIGRLWARSRFSWIAIAGINRRSIDAMAESELLAIGRSGVALGPFAPLRPITRNCKQEGSDNFRCTSHCWMFDLHWNSENNKLNETYLHIYVQQSNLWFFHSEDVPRGLMHRCWCWKTSPVCCLSWKRLSFHWPGWRLCISLRRRSDSILSGTTDQQAGRDGRF